MKRLDIQDEVELTLQSLDKMDRAEVDVGFEEKLTHKITFLPQVRMIRWLSYSTAAVILLTLTNIGIMSFSTPEIDPNRETYFDVLREDFLYKAGNYIEIE